MALKVVSGAARTMWFLQMPIPREIEREGCRFATMGQSMARMGCECERGGMHPYCRTRDTTANAGSKTSRIKLWWISDYKDESFFYTTDS